MAPSPPLGHVIGGRLGSETPSAWTTHPLNSPRGCSKPPEGAGTIFVTDPDGGDGGALGASRSHRSPVPASGASIALPAFDGAVTQVAQYFWTQRRTTS